MGFHYGSVLIGFAIDLSGSMKESIRNDIDETMSRLRSVRQSLEQFAKEARSTIQTNRQEENEIIVKVFAYGFGFTLPDKEICDLLTLLKIDRHTYLHEDIPSTTVDMQRSYKGGYSDLGRIARSYGYENLLVDFATKYISQEDAGKLAQELEKDQQSAHRLASLIPKSFLEASGKILFQKGVNKLLGPGAVGDDAQEAQNLALKLIARADGGSSVEETRNRIIRESKRKFSDQVDKIGNITLPLEELVDLWEQYQGDDEDIEKINELIYGQTPMQRTLEIINQRFDHEMKKLPQDTQLFLFILSDGQPTDGDPLLLANELRKKNVTIISCFVTNEDITEPRVLSNHLDSGWTDAAKLMFNIASWDKDNSQIVQFLRERRWNIQPNAKLFVQVNHSEILAEFLQGLLGLVQNNIIGTGRYTDNY